MQEHNEHQPEAGLTLPANQISMWDTIRYGGTAQQVSPFARDPWEEAHRRVLARHKLWLESLQHEYPSPYAHYRIGVYIRFFNQTRYDDYLLFHKQEFVDTIGLCPNWTLVDFYVDEGQTAPFMENAKEWSRLLQDCLDGRIDLIITQKVSNVTRSPAEITLVARLLATQKKSIGIYFVNEDIFTLASYYQDDMREKKFSRLPTGRCSRMTLKKNGGSCLINHKYTNAEQKERIRQRVRVQIDEENYQFFPERKEPDYYDNDVNQRVGVYVRVSTDDPRQTTSYELQKKYYEDFVVRHPRWTLVDIYADEGISGTSTRHRDEFNRMIAECKGGKIDLIITKSVSRFARNVVDFLGMVRMLSERNPPIGVFFEAENIFSLNETSNMALSFQATMAEEESRNKSRSMETSLRMRLDHGLPLTPKLLGFMHNSEGKLIPNPDTKHIPRLMFYMYLYGYSTQQIADALTVLEKKTYLGNVKWTASGVAASMRNERYCGDVYTRKTFTKDVLSHKSVKNRGERPISHYYDEHEGIISRDDFIAVQHMLKNSKYGNKSMLPELRVITEGLLKGYVIINPRWSGFREPEYIHASASAYSHGENQKQQAQSLQFEVEAGDFDMRGFEVAHTDLFNVQQTPHVTFFEDSIKFGIECIRRMKSDFYVELLIHPAQRKFAVRAANKQNKNAVIWAKSRNGRTEARPIACSAFVDTIYSLFGWNRDHKYKMYSTLISNGDEEVFIFNADEAAAYIQTEKIPGADGSEAFIEPVAKTSAHVMGIPACYTDSFGNDFYVEQTYSALANQTREQWQIRVEGQLCSTGIQLNVTDYDTLRTFIMQELGDWHPQEVEQYEQQ